MKILVVDDEPLARERLRALLEDISPDHDVTLAGNGADALAMHQQHPADVALLDIRMPGMDGLELASHLNRQPQPPAVIFTTAYDEHALRAFDAYALDYVLKPFEDSRLVSAVASGTVPRTR